MPSEAIRYLIVPGWYNSGEDHWQTHWQAVLPNSSRVEQADWANPQRHAWVAQLDAAVRDSERPVMLIAHSLGCVAVAHWAANAPAATLRRVRGALLVAPADVERPNCPPALQGFAPIPQQRLPFPSQLVASDNDPAASAARALELARSWGSEAGVLTGAGHINAKAGFHRWEQGFAYLYRLQTRLAMRAA
ncbi:alpha/beta hydrolase [Pseudomonas typographi]|uniref:Alpha/beta hydrolase n=1 Tax=Pseudomonas typographi TaxID=2715964 RepID=A0ABR7YZ83_9PSED|nr:alpha/beta hydrolase [Pseudomonas typographi]MBD1550020.1 alpha/beta hydrolase [Pseudomonas typographi]MBD1585402.1 alpha/beta hydrolase [Pseudomonas typographi]MBD1598484.1 alpha/beta hydrolase [Pseudomonas typographi]